MNVKLEPVHSSYVTDIPQRKRRHSDNDNSYDAMCENRKPSLAIQIEDCQKNINRYRVLAATHERVSMRKYYWQQHAINLREFASLTNG